MQTMTKGALIATVLGAILGTLWFGIEQYAANHSARTELESLKKGIAEAQETRQREIKADVKAGQNKRSLTLPVQASIEKARKETRNEQTQDENQAGGTARAAVPDAGLRSSITEANRAIKAARNLP